MRDAKRFSFTRDEYNAALAELREYCETPSDRAEARRLLPYLGRRGTRAEMMERFERRKKLGEKA